MFEVESGGVTNLIREMAHRIRNTSEQLRETQITLLVTSSYPIKLATMPCPKLKGRMSGDVATASEAQNVF